MRFASILTSGLTSLSGAILAEASGGDSFLGPVFTAPVNISKSPSLSSSLGQMAQDITTALNAAFGQETENSVAICGFSIHDFGESPLFDYYHTGNDLSPNGTGNVGPDTVFRIGSISKLFTVYQLLLQGGHNLLNEPIWRYLDGLPANDDYNANPTVKWDEITVGALAGQMGGILRDYNHADLAGLNLPFQELGLPKLSDEDIPHCDGSLSQPLCSRNGEGLWDLELGDDMPAGGIYSSARDLAVFGKAILQSTQLPPVVTRRWLKPITHTSSLYSSVGQPWEIYRQADRDHVVDYYTKGGSIGSYESLIVLIPDYGISFSVLTVGKDSHLGLKLADVIKDTVLAGVATAAREQSAQQFAGRYEITDQPGNLLIIAVDEKPGLVIREWKSNSIDFLQVAQDYAASTGSGLQSVRLYPTGISNCDQVIFRAVYNTTSGTSQSGLFERGYQAWEGVDQLVYGQRPLDEFVFEMEDHLATKVECKGLLRTLERVG
ncbi:hypothetical protein PCG10_009453 [Penicillium crustosum]|uniref:Beta-lactamase-related domain-containing protein n=1 Tax=Penicillium crustosum TaxID=36656 RepID=A0A9P5GK73_PENCR|nr:Beta-lactamase-like protein [Penicillium crustosum]KAF7519973.1 hypothetical protein PCG10_009453 [Penicillium crustosum]KAJ5417670.1 Beta-lactamase-like protein [Penicillium crustosum]